ncbi:MAG: N-6 DNA methylase [Thermodesulfobacteriota bacterium]|nr:N-6 DNA methylase [Thermodesulfobacteriota bacterium]
MTRRLSNPYERIAHKTERTNNQKMVQWMNEIILEKHLNLGMAEQETAGADRKQPDIVIKKRTGGEEILCVMELKIPAFDPFHQEELVEPARKKATRRHSPYFATSNFRELIWFNTERANSLAPIEKQIVQRYTLSSMTDPDTIEESGIKSAIRRGLERFLIDLVEVSTGQKAEPKHAIDEILIYRLQNTINALAIHYKRIIEEKVKGDRKFSKHLQTWFIEQGWTFGFQDHDYGKAARQTAYLLVNKILFYSVIQPIRRLDPLEIPKSLKSGDLLQSTLQGFFNLVLKIDYETIYSTDFIDQIAFPENTDVVDEIKELIEVLAKYDFSRLGYDVIGRIFEKLIPEEERHILGQYFTNPDVVDLILRFCLKHETDKILDPACGAGTFLVRAYQHKKLMNQRLTHEEILKTLWGNDIAKFPAHLTTINLAINDLRSDENYPRVIRKDFFDLLPDRVEFALPESWRKVQIKGLGKIEKTLEHPRFFDALAGNPPYTRHLEIEDIQEKAEGYKDKLIRKALISPDGRKLADISKRAGIYAYFFIHGTKFLQNGGRFGFIVSNSWLDADYGKGLQEHFLSHYKIMAIIESKVERWFEDADVNTVIVILEKAGGERLKKERDAHMVRFAYLKKPLRHFIPAAENMWQKEVGRLDAIDKLIKTILAHSTYYENDDLRVYPRNQKELWEEGYDPEEGRYTGAKWGKYIRAPKIFFTLMEKTREKLLPLRLFAEVNEGKPTGANDFFYIRREIAEKFKIEKRYLRPGLMKPRGNNFLELLPQHLDRYFFTVDEDKSKLKGTGALSYIKHGEQLKIHTGSTYKNKTDWYKFGVREPADLLVPCGMRERLFCVMNSAKAISSNSFTEIRLKNKADMPAVWTFMNSSLGWLFLEINGRPLGGGGGMLKVDPTDIRKMQIIAPEHFKKSILPRIHALLKRPVGTVEQESAAEDRRLIDDYVLGDVLSLFLQEQEEVREAVNDLVKTRLQKAQSLKKAKKTTEGFDLDLMTQNILTRMGENNLATFFKARITSVACSALNLPKRADPIEVENSLLGWRLKVGKKGIDCSSEPQARYLKIFVEMGWDYAPVPQEESFLSSIIDKWEDLFEKAQAVLEEHTVSILQRNTRDRLVHTVWKKLQEMME